jgi:triosephosphate isomerase
VKKQLENTIFKLDPEDFARVIIAYEPVWAIGTGVNATSEQAQEMHFFIRELIWNKFGAEMAADKTILYGGSCNAKNAGELFSMPDVDGGLIGGASLKAEEFVQIVNAAGE